MSHPQNIAHQHRTWSELPLFLPERWIATEDDIAAWVDIIALRHLADTLLQLLDPEDAHTVLDDVATIGDDALETERWLCDDWPHDRAADMLTAWAAA